MKDPFFEPSHDELVHALREVEERMAPLFRERRAIRQALADQRPPPLPERRRDRSRIQEAVARCPRCGDRLPKEDVMLSDEIAKAIEDLKAANRQMEVVLDRLLESVKGSEEGWPVPAEPLPTPPPDLSDSLE